ncbi:MAG: hypothetical protein WD271_02750 [Acidimicrobiia bacterium]
MSDDELAKSLERSIELRVRKLSPRADIEDLFARVGRRATRQRRAFVAGLVAVLVAAGYAGYLIGNANEASGTRAVAAQSDGLPSPEASSSALEPADVDAARAAIAQAFRDAFAGSTPERTRVAALQDGDSLQGFRREVLTYAELHGYTSEQLDGISINVLDVAFIDQTHGAVRFTVTVPEHGDVLVDRVGYAVFDGGRWKVAVRTACDLLSLGGLRQRCPPQ